MILDDGEEHHVPLEDVGVVVVESQQIQMTSALFAALMEHGAVVLHADRRHMPVGMTLPLEGNDTQSERQRMQITAGRPLVKRLWAQTVKAKIRNQAALLKSLELPHESLDRWTVQVKSGDTGNLEARAAARYWQLVFTPAGLEGFLRDREGGPPNPHLNYGYAILRAVMARAIVATGLLPSLGIHHRNRYNAFCLVDDLMEPYRPYVDGIVVELCMEAGKDAMLGREARARLLGIPAVDVMLDDTQHPLMVAAQRTAYSLHACFAGDGKTILYPALDQH